MANVHLVFLIVITIAAAVHFRVTSGFEWTSTSPPDGSTVYACLGEKASFRWQYSTSVEETVVYIEWQQTTDDGKTRLATYLEELFSKFPSIKLTVAFLPNSGIEISNYTWADYGQYQVTVHYTHNGVLQSQSRSVILAPPDAPILDGGRLVASIQSEPVIDVTSGQRHLQLTCGTFLKEGGRPLSVIWTTPSGEKEDSTSHTDGSFHLTLANPVQGGSYRCQLNDPSLAARCVKGVSALRLGAHVHVDEVEARLTLLEGRVRGVEEERLASQITRLQDEISRGQTVDTKLTSDVEQLAKELKALIQQTESKCAADVDYLRQQVSDIRDNYNTCCSTDIPDTSTSPTDIPDTSTSPTGIPDTSTSPTGIPDTSTSPADITRSSSTTETNRTPASCLDVREYDTSNSIHTLTVSNTEMEVFCDQTTAGGGWAVIQRRVDGQVDFYRNWTDYQRGFGDLTHEFWLGLDNIHLLTSSQNYGLRVDLEDWDGSTAYAEYRDFYISGPDDFYRLHISGYSNTSTAGDSMIQHHNLNNMQFSTPDKDHDKSGAHCARDRHGAWWYNACTWANPNGRYMDAGGSGWDGIMWYHWKNDKRSLKHVEMKIRPRT